ncbi:MAG: ribonuclease P protein component, partial [Candidatus Neomarinimicrobiota bacterium]
FPLKQHLPRKHRLTKKHEFDGIYARGRKTVCGRLSAKVANGDLARLGIAVGRQYGASSDRNLFKRRVREVFRQRLEHLPPIEMVISVRPGRKPANYRDIQLLFDEIVSQYSHSRTKAGN